MGMLFIFFSLFLLWVQNSVQTGFLHKDDVNALNSMAGRLRMLNQGYSPTSCSEHPKRRSSAEIRCRCNFQSHTLCRVTFLNFSGLHLKGVVPPETANLRYLEELDLRKNELHGNIPSSFRNLSRLVYFYLNDNKLEGPIPSIIGEMKSLKLLHLSDNWFNGSIPPSLSSLPFLQFLYLHNNLLSGEIPAQLGNITSLVELDLSDNQLSGVLPQELGYLVNLQCLWLINNELSGELPGSLAALKNMANLFIFGNKFSGRIPDYIGEWKNLKFLGLIGNSFEGPFPNALLSLNLTELHVSDLLKENGERGFVFPDISRMANLKWVTLRNCSLMGQIPETLGQMKYLYYMDLSFNNLTGGIPCFNANQRPQYMYLNGNKLNGSLPRWLTASTNSYADISENNFTAAFTQLQGNSTNVNSFACCADSENLSTAWQRNNYRFDTDKSFIDHLYINCGGEGVVSNGVHYQADLQPDGESTFFLSEDKAWGYSSQGIFIATTHDQYTVEKSCGISSDDAPLYKTARISPISLKYYGFRMKNGKYRVKLHFAEIIYGESKSPNSKGKRVFDVAVQGKKVLENFNIREAAMGVNRSVTSEFISTVSNHQLEIHLYWTGKGSIRTPMEYYGPLISAISVSAVPRKSSVKPSPMSIAALVGSALLLPLLILVFISKLGCLGGKKSRTKAKGLELLPGGGSFNFRQIKAATQNFNPANKIGEGGFGSVYKGVLSNGTEIAVKQLSSKSKQGTREFVNEVGTIFALQHPNLVKLLGCCTEDNQLLLVYEYMENNSLAHALFCSEELRLKLNWQNRFKICLGIAKGLAYLHEESKLKVVHRDIKPTNVLLDKDLNAKISDFGLAKLYEAEKTHVITRIAGTTGYMAPEYAMRGYLTSKVDVYSFGVVVLEIVSGKNGTSYRPNDESVYLLDLAYVLQEKGDLLSLIDPVLKYDYSVKQAMTVLDLAMLCTNPSPTLRPTMSEVVKVLEGKSKIKAPSFHVPYSTDDFAMATAVASLIPHTRSGSNSTGKRSNPVSYDVVSRDDDDADGTDEDCSSEIIGKTDSLVKES